jgi:hypothetical protein
MKVKSRSSRFQISKHGSKSVVKLRLKVALTNLSKDFTASRLRGERVHVDVTRRW